jgi:quinol-cytochrome oxidoreductase complex cytochrome b subunit
MAALGVGLGFLSVEVIGVVLLPIIVPLLMVAGRRRLATASLVTLVVGYELPVAAIAGADILQSIAGGFSVGNPASTIVWLLTVAVVGLLMLVVGLRFARRYDGAVKEGRHRSQLC